MNNKGIFFIPLILLIASVSIIVVSIRGSVEDENQRDRELINGTIHP